MQLEISCGDQEMKPADVGRAVEPAIWMVRELVSTHPAAQLASFGLPANDYFASLAAA
jgi:hypothetical protein